MTIYVLIPIPNLNMYLQKENSNNKILQIKGGGGYGGGEGGGRIIIMKLNRTNQKQKKTHPKR